MKGNERQRTTCAGDNVIRGREDKGIEGETRCKK